MHLGAVLKRFRKEQKLTLKDVASKSGISEGFLSQVENNVNSPSVDTLMSICGALNINAGDVLNRVEEEEDYVIIRKSEWEDVDFPHSGFVTRRFFPPENRTVIDSAILVLEPGKSIPGRKNIKNGQEIFSVLKGELEFQHAGNSFGMKEGDSAHFWPKNDKDRIVNNSKKQTIILWVGTL